MATIAQIKKLQFPIAKAVLLGKPNAPKLGALILGMPGGGKTALGFQLGDMLNEDAEIQQLCKDCNIDRIKTYEIRGPSLADPSFVTGIPDVSGAVTTLKRMNMLPPPNTPAIILIDELGATHQQIRAALTQLIYDKKAGEYELDPRTYIIATGNRVSDRAGATKIETHVANRFRHFTLDTDLQEWQAFVASKGLPDRLIAFLQQRPDLLHKFDPKGDDLAFPSPRTWEEVAIDMALLTTPDEILMSAASLVGDGPAAELAAFLTRAQVIPDWKTFREMPAGDAADLLRKSESGVQYAAMTMTANAIKDTADVDWAVGVFESVAPELAVGFFNMANHVFKKGAVTLSSKKAIAFAQKTGAALFKA